MRSKKRVLLWAIVWLFCGCTAGVSDCAAQESVDLPVRQWTDTFYLSDCSFSSVGRNRFFILEPGYQLTLSGVEGADSVLLQITVLHETETVAGVETRIVEERESVNGRLIEISRNFFAFCQKDKSIYYFGEDVDMYKDDTVAGHGGNWRAGEGENRPGLVMPGLVLLGSSFYQEIAPEAAMDRARIVSDSQVLETPAGRFEQCLLTEETTPLEPHALEYKVHAPGIGLVKDGSLLLVRYGMADKGER